MGRSQYKIFDDAEKRPYFLTCTVLNWLPLFNRPDTVQIVLDSLTFLCREKRLTLFAYVILENHLHLVAESDDLSKEIGTFKSYTARRIIDLLKEKKAASILWQLNFFKKQHKTDRPYQFWQEGSHPQQIQSEEMMVQKIEYIHYNPVRRGYVEEPRHWRYSSASNYAGCGGLLEVTMAW